MSTFALDVAKFCEKAKGNGDLVLRKLLIDLSAEVVKRSPVGNPDLWAVNADAVAMRSKENRLTYNLMVDAANAMLGPGEKKMRKLGKVRMEQGLKGQGQGYVGGRFRANWVMTVTTAPTGTTEDVDPSGAATMAKHQVVASAAAMGNVYWLLNNLPYAIPLEHGHSTQAPEGMVGITAARFQEFVRKAVGEVPK